MTNLLETAISPVGSTMYIWGGGWDGGDCCAGDDAVRIGLSPKWKEFADKQDSSYNFKDTRYMRRMGLDCSGYIGWVVYNTFYDVPNQTGFVYPSTSVAEAYAKLGWGDYIPSYESIYGKYYLPDSSLLSTDANFKSNQQSLNDFLTEFKPGDICSMKGHVWLSLGQCEDGSVLLVHSSPPGVRICGTKLADGSLSDAVFLARRIMQYYYPDWYLRYPNCSVDYRYITTSSKMRWSPSVLSDPDGLQSMSAEQVVNNLWAAYSINSYNIPYVY